MTFEILSTGDYCGLFAYFDTIAHTDELKALVTEEILS